MRSRSRSDLRIALASAVIALATMAGCRLFVDLEGLGDGAPLGNDGAAVPDVTSNDGATTDAGSDVTTIPDVIEEPLPDGACPSRGGPTPVRVTSGTTSFCIDSTEVTRDQYDAFLKSSPPAGVAECAWKLASGYVPSLEWPPLPATRSLPVVGVDWCDSKAFCAWAGKRLCGAIGGGALSPAELSLSARSEFVFACSNGGTRVYPYGNAYNPNTCNGEDLAAGRVLAVGSLAGCTGPAPAIYDMSGNVHEWLNGCETSADAGPQDQRCGLSGSAFTHPSADMACNVVETAERSARVNEFGIRCCSP
ncbi:MAG: SUMF1/EgtB/PvdO family nonheme iron enzyme [Deltaproteobacteria bacterium]|nr:SUMF1/EgtB/PvdO family nonheme iron enzyme [Deltaproteobacteria bacterium]